MIKVIHSKSTNHYTLLTDLYLNKRFGNLMHKTHQALSKTNTLTIDKLPGYYEN